MYSIATSQRQKSIVVLSMMTHQNPVFTNLSTWESGKDPYDKLEIGMKHLMRIDKDALFYIETSKKLMQYLHQEFQKLDEAYLPWVRFLDISRIKKESYPGKKEGSQGYTFKQEMEELVIGIIGQNQTILTLDWRIAKKILSVPIVFPENSQLLSLISKEVILQAFQIEIDKALSRLAWWPSTILTDLAKQTLQNLHYHFNGERSNNLLSQAMLVGRFDKDNFGLKNTLILGEDGGLFLLLNRLTKEQQEEMVKENIVTEAYLKDKIQPKDEGRGVSQGDKVIIGQGGFGKVKFALSLFGSKKGPGEIICVRKTRNFKQLTPKHEVFIVSALHLATEATLADYFARTVAEKVSAPQIFDLAIVATNEHQEVSLTHQKAYLMMEMFPHNTATKIFKEPKYQVWKYQKPFLQEMMHSILELLKNRFVFTDLKPDNVLFDPETFKSTIIDLGGIIKINDADSLENWDKYKYSFQLTPGYCAPEMQEYPTIINLSKALAYTCGKVLEEVVQKTDYDQQTLKGLIDKLTYSKPEERMTIEETIKRLEEMGDDANNEDILLNHYIAKIKGRIENNRPSISLNEDILTTKELYIDLKITLKDPETYQDQETEDLFQRMDSFLEGKQSQEQVMAIFGSAGSGKSIALQLKFIEAIQKWTRGQPLPIYFNLANGIDLKTIINSMNAELGTNLKLSELKTEVHLYIDSFDEGLEIEKKRETLIKEYLTELKNSRTKIIITCRSNYLEGDSSHSWFTPQVNAFNKLVVRYIAPMSYVAEGDAVKNDPNWKKRVTDYLVRQSKTKGIQINPKDVELALEKMSIFNLDKLIETGFMFHIVMEVFPELMKDGNQSQSRSKQDIYLKYITKYQKERLDQLNEEQRNQLIKCLSFMSKRQEKVEFSLIRAMKDFGKYLAVQLHLQNQLRLKQDSSIFQAMGYENTTYFKKQSLWHVLQILPLKIETKHSKDLKNQEVKIGFIHDTIKNCYFLEAIQEEMSQNGKSKILSSKSIVGDSELVNFIADAACHDDVLKSYLRLAIDFTKEDKSERAAIYAANCITILVSAGYSFSGQDLSNVHLKGSNLENGIFFNANFMGADLRETHLKNIQAKGACFKKSNLIGARLGILADLEGHLHSTWSVSFSPDGRYVASSSQDKTVKIWEIQTNKCVSTLEGHDDSVLSVSFSPDGRYVASASTDKTVKIWEIQTNKCLSTLQGHTEMVNSVSFSSDGRYVASASTDSTVKIWEIQTNKCLSTLQGHTEIVTSVSFSSDGRYVASASTDSTVKIWEIQTNKCLSTLQGHTWEVTSVSFSSDGRYVASASRDKTVKIWEIQTNKCLSTLQGHTWEVTSVSFSSDGRYVASASYDKTVKIWEIQTNKCLSTLQGHTEIVTSVSFSSDGRYVASASRDTTVKIWEIQTNKYLSTLQGHTSSVNSVSFSSDGRYVASASTDKTVKIWEIQNNKCLSTLRGHTEMVNSVSFSSDGRYVASASTDSTVKIWEIQTNKCLSTLQGHTEMVNSVSFSSDGRYVASASTDSTVKIWEIQTNKCLSTLQGHTEIVTSVSFSSDGRYVASASTDSTVKIWEIQTNKCLSTLQGHTWEVTSVSFSSDGRYVASASRDKTVKIWEIQTNKCLSTLQGHTWEVTSVSFSSDGRYVASASRDKTVKIWEIQTNKCLSTLQGHTWEVTSVSFSSDGGYVASASSDRSVMISTNNNGIWVLDKIFADLPLNISDVVIEEATLSTMTLKIFEQREAKVAKNNIIINTVPEIEDNLLDARSTADELSAQFLKDPINKYLENKRPKLVQIALPIQNQRELLPYGVKMKEDDVIVNHSIMIKGNKVLSIDANLPRISSGEQKRLEHRIEVIQKEQNQLRVKVQDAVTLKAKIQKQIETHNDNAEYKNYFRIFYWAAINILKKYQTLSTDLGQDQINSQTNKQLEKFVSSVVKVLDRIIDAAEGAVKVNRMKNKVTAINAIIRNKFKTHDDISLKIAQVALAMTEARKKLLDKSQPTPVSDRSKFKRGIDWINDSLKGIKKLLFQELKIEAAKTFSVELALEDVALFFGYLCINAKHVIKDQRTLEDQCINLVRNDAFYVVIANIQKGLSKKEATQSVKKNEVKSKRTETLDKNENNFENGQIEAMNILKLSPSYISGHLDTITSVAVTSDQKYVVSGSLDKTIGMWDIAEKKLLYRFEKAHSDSIMTIAVTIDMTFIVSGSNDKTIAVWDLEEKKLHHLFKDAHSGNIISVAVTSDSKYIVSAGEDKTIKVWNIFEKKKLQQHEAAHQDRITSVSVTSDKKYVVSGSNDKTIAVWDLKELKLLHRFEAAHFDGITSVTVTSDNRYIVSAGKDKTIKVWDIFDKKNLHRFEEAHSDIITSVAVTSDNKYIVSGSHDKTIGVWDIAEKKLRHRFEEAHSDSIMSSAVTSDMTYIVSGSADWSIGVFNLEWVIGISKDLESSTKVSRMLDLFKDLSNHNWNALNFITFLLPLTAYRKCIDFVIENKIKLAHDEFNSTALDYLLSYNGDQNPQTKEFFAYFFRKLPSLWDLSSMKIIQNLSQNITKIYKQHGEKIFLNTLNALISTEISRFIDNSHQLPSSGRISSNRSKCFLTVEERSVKLDDNAFKRNPKKFISSIIYSPAFRFLL